MARAIGSTRSTDTNTKGATLRASSGGGMTFTKARGLGASMVEDLDGVTTAKANVLVNVVMAKAKAQYRADRIAAARDRLADRQAHSPLACRY